VKKSQAGFTFIELITASAASGIVILAATAFMLKATSWYGEVSAKIAINRHARETFDVLAFGGQSVNAGNDGTKNVYGIPQRRTAPASGLRSNYALQYTSNNLTLTPDTFAGMTIDCVSAANPLPDCGAGSKTVQGWLGNDIQINTASRSVLNLTVETTIDVMNPYEIQRAENPVGFHEIYRTVFTLNREEADP
jgi:prepilin-type N-terminal cleavage/methylation domain-containing protein